MKIIFILAFLPGIIFLSNGCLETPDGHLHPVAFSVSGILGHEINSGFEGRLSGFITDSTSEAVAIFHKDSLETGGSWRGEHAGKWLYAAALAYDRTGNISLLESITGVADFLVRQQRENGYLGTYADTLRFYADPVIPRQTWDVWINGYMLKGLLETARVTGEKRYLDASRRIADLMIRTFMTGDKDLCNSGPWSGTASAAIIGEFADLYAFTGEKKYLDFAVFAIEELNRRPGTGILQRLLKEYDMAEIGEGKMYENLRCINGIAKVYLHTGSPDYLQAVTHAWNDVVENHLNPSGAPSGGAGIHRECFNINYTFSPYAFSETCALMEWLSLNRLLLEATGEAKYASQLEISSYNAVVGAHFPDGNGWQYHSVMNGTRSRTGDWACCSSSGTIILEEMAGTIYTVHPENLVVNIYTPSWMDSDFNGTKFRLKQETDYPFGEEVRFLVQTVSPVRISLSLRVPEWSDEFTVYINGVSAVTTENKGFMTIDREWTDGDILTLKIGLDPHIKTAVREYNEQGWYLDGRNVYTSFFAGPLLYGTSHTGTLTIVDSSVSALVSCGEDTETPYRRFCLTAANDTIYRLVPYFDINKRADRSDHVVWFLTKDPEM